MAREHLFWGFEPWLKTHQLLDLSHGSGTPFLGVLSHGSGPNFLGVRAMAQSLYFLGGDESWLKTQLLLGLQPMFLPNLTQNKEVR